MLSCQVVGLLGGRRKARVYVRVGLPVVPGTEAMMTVTWRQGPDKTEQKTRVYVHGRVFAFAKK